MKDAISRSVATDQDGREITDRGTPLFPIAIYQENIHEYVGSEISPHWHQEMEFFLLIEGAVRVSLMNEVYDLHPGDACFINSNVLHSMACLITAPCYYRSIVFDPMIIAGAHGSVYDVHYVRPYRHQGAPLCFIDKDTSGYSSIIKNFQQAFNACQDQPLAYEFQVRDALSQLLLHFREELPKGKNLQTQSQQELRMKQMLSWIEAHFHETIHVSQVAKAANIGVRECQRYFANLLQLTPLQYILRQRVTAAAKLLTSTDLPITEIAFSCGFKSPSYFTKQFKTVTGRSPRTYRNQLRT